MIRRPDNEAVGMSFAIVLMISQRLNLVQCERLIVMHEVNHHEMRCGPW